MDQSNSQQLPKREARESAFLVVFEKIFSPELTYDAVLSNNEVSEFFKADGFTKNLVNSVFDHIEEIDALISANLVGWTFERISNVSKSVLRLATAEMKYRKTDSKVIYNEAVELTKKYSDNADASFVNGVLANIEKQVRS